QPRDRRGRAARALRRLEGLEQHEPRAGEGRPSVLHDYEDGVSPVSVSTSIAGSCARSRPAEVPRNASSETSSWQTKPEPGSDPAASSSSIPTAPAAVVQAIAVRPAPATSRGRYVRTNSSRALRPPLIPPAAA